MDNIVTCDIQTRDGESSTIPFHRHCQKTVLSAYGPNGNGATWNILDSQEFDNLPADWKTRFMHTSDINITSDLKAILSLIDEVAKARLHTKFTIDFDVGIPSPTTSVDLTTDEVQTVKLPKHKLSFEAYDRVETWVDNVVMDDDATVVIPLDNNILATCHKPVG